MFLAATEQGPKGPDSSLCQTQADVERERQTCTLPSETARNTGGPSGVET